MNAATPVTPPVRAPQMADPAKYEGKTACVIGSGFGGMALAIRLQSAGIATTVIESRDKPGGRAYFWEKDGFTFDGGPTVVTDPPCLKELWEITGHDMAEDVELMKVMPFYRLNWPDGTNFDYSNDEESLNAEIAKLDPADIAGYAQFLEYAAGVYEEGYLKLGTVPFLDFKSMLKAAPALIKKQAWRSVYSMVSSYVKSEKLREALSFHTLLVGGNPMNTSSIYALIHKLEKDGGVWWTRGGTNRLIAGMVRHFERLGGTMRLGDAVTQVHTVGNKASEVETASGWKQRFDAVASNADIMHSYRDLLSGSKRGKDYAKSLSRKSFWAVCGAFRSRRHMARHSASHDPVRPALQRLARRHLQAGRSAAGFQHLLAPPDGDRSQHGTQRQEHILRAGAGCTYGQAGGRLGRSRPDPGKADSGRDWPSPDP